MKNNKIKLALCLSSAVILLPMLAGLLFWNWNGLPDSFATYWGADGNADGWSGKAVTVFVLPCVFLLLHWICLWITAADPKNKGQNNKAMGMIFWIVPLISLFSNGIMYSTALGKELNAELLLPAVLGLMFIAIGNYLPKLKQNYTLGIKLPWTLANEENWNKTHRLGGKLWVAGGVLMLFSVFLPKTIMFFILIAVFVVLVTLPVIYSYRFHKKHPGAKATAQIFDTGSAEYKYFSIGSKAALAVLAVLVIVILVLSFTGSIQIRYGDRTFKIEADYWQDLEIEYAAIDRIEYREDCETGDRTNGFGSPRLSMGMFQNKEFGVYTRYAYTGCHACIVLAVDERILVVSGADDESTRAIYDELSARIAG